MPSSPIAPLPQHAKARKPYVPPTIVRHGDIQQLTHGSTLYYGTLFGMTSGTKGLTPQLPDAPMK